MTSHYLYSIIKVDKLTQQEEQSMGKPALDLKGKKFGRLTAIKRVDKPKGTTQTAAYWLFECECGETRIRKGSEVARVGGSCGCLKSEVNSEAMKKMQIDKHGTIQDRFFNRFKKDPSGCWIWSSHSDKDGYGLLPGNNGSTRAHRLSYEIHVGAIGCGLVVCHTCDNPSCVNPDHLFVGTAKDNCDDMISKNRDRIIGSRNNKAKLTEENINAIRESKDSLSETADYYGVSISTIKRIKSGESWRHVK